MKLRTLMFSAIVLAGPARTIAGPVPGPAPQPTPAPAPTAVV